MSKPRQKIALSSPSADLSAFPRWRLRTDFPLYRAHTVGSSPWWFSSSLFERFDLTPPNGTCYLATDVATALRERFGHDLVEQGVVTFEAATRTQVSTLKTPAARWLANTCHGRAAELGVTRELGTCEGYDLPQTWAAAFFDTGKHAGIRYQTRFSTATKANAAALFDIDGERDWPTDPEPLDGVAACRQAGIAVARRPTRRQLRIQEPHA